MQKAVRTGKLKWENLSFWDKAELYNYWNLVGFTGSILLFFGSLLYCFSDFVPLFESEMILGLGTFCVWVKTLQFFKGYDPYDMFSRTL